jgi:hypothetical protein
MYMVASFPSLVDLFCDFRGSAELQANIEGRPVAILTEEQIRFLAGSAIFQPSGLLLNLRHMQR